MALGKTMKSLKDLLGLLSHDLEKAEGGNKAASQRVRKNSITLQKVAKEYRRESVDYEKKAKRGKKAKKSARTVAHKKAVKKKAAPVKKKKVAKRRS